MAVTHDGRGEHSAPPLLPNRSDANLGDVVKASLTDPANRPLLFGGAVCLALFGLLFHESLWNFYYAWTTDDNYSHGFLVPFISLYFASQIFKRGPVAMESGVALGSLLMGLGLVVHLVTIPLPIPFLGNLAVLVALAGGFTLLAGSAALKRYWFVFFFLIFAVPLPVALYARIASPLQLLASKVASAFMNATGVPVLCEGNRMTLPGGVQMFVAEACSGMRQLTGFLALSAAVAYLCMRPAWYRVILIAAALPIALFANIARMVITGYIMHFVNPAYASGAYHTLEGVLLMAFGLFLLNSVSMLMDLFCADSRGRIRNRSGRSASRTRLRGRTCPERSADAPGRRRLGGRTDHRQTLAEHSQGASMTPIKRCVLCAGFLMFGLAAQAGLERINATERPLLRQSLATIPMELEGWSGATNRWTPRSSSAPRPPNTSAAFMRAASIRASSSRSGSTIRSRGPTSATPRRSASPQAAGRRSSRRPASWRSPAADGKELRLTRLGYGKEDLVKHVGFWYYIFGEGKLENMVRRLPITSRSSHGRTTRGSSMTVEVFYPGETDPDAVALVEFARKLAAALEPILPVDRAEYYVP